MPSEIGGPGATAIARDLADRIGVNMLDATPDFRPATERRFWAKVDKRGPSECWPWTAHVDRYGYGTFRPGGTAPTMAASRFSWLLANPAAEIDSAQHVCHRCDNRQCVNPAHLFLGTALDNVRDRILKGRFTTRPYVPRPQRDRAVVALAKVPSKPKTLSLASFAPQPRVLQEKLPCEVDSCERVREGRSNMCRLHKRRLDRYGETDARRMGKLQVPRSADQVRAKILANIKASDSGCWVWQRSRSVRGGYPALRWAGIYPGHRVSYTIFVGLIPDGLHVLHRCDNPPCVNPEHLFVGTNADNIADKTAKGRNVGFVAGRVGRRGASAPNAKLTDAEVVYIRASTERGVDLARRFGVAQQTICNIRKGRRWATSPTEGQ